MESFRMIEVDEVDLTTSWLSVTTTEALSRENGIIIYLVEGIWVQQWMICAMRSDWFMKDDFDLIRKKEVYQKRKL